MKAHLKQSNRELSGVLHDVEHDGRLVSLSSVAAVGNRMPTDGTAEKASVAKLVG